ncbi:MAG TPA: exopolysaccharide biosynthesis polyprenyl glycosylphosphotransferase [Geminicoccus sp.]|uniref:exopolysaccharide biosynthesis polyprenyl glycosylphosphotransferase n=1 Tax=Geminicoccus sp. TaxID=2024832 RepID=UPI002E36F75E|nr:exopolysaccharide biosynthesis polyprenyl glycosylphosphotransferase [Geminicoccus sp.]HEX2526154.1 exopolysaccharide biosynthesis polyprenyl glycosylphosphotransferase [Geminicoccus sp.]
MATNILLEDGKAKQRSNRRTAVAERTAGNGLITIDAFILVAALIVALLADRWTLPSFMLMLVQLAIFIGWKAIFGLYPGHGVARAQRMQKVILAVGAAVVTNLGLVEVARQLVGETESGFPFWPILMTAVLIGLGEPMARRLLIRLGRWQQPVFIFGGGDAASAVVRQLGFYPHLGLHPVCIVDESSIYIPDESQGIPVIRFRELGQHAALLNITTTAIIVEQLVERTFILRLYTTGIFKKVLLVPNCHDLISLNSSIRPVGGMLAIQAGSERPSKAAAWVKRAFDKIGSGCVLVLLSPLFALLSAMVRADSPGPAIFSQPRWAGADRQFTAMKFRTMYTDGERRLRRHFLNNPDAEQEYARYRKLDNDPRVTKIGRFLRATSLDELPQLINVWRGDMSIVGPRPYTMDEVSKLGPATDMLSIVRPGITGFWQVSGRNQRTFRERIEMDCYYVRNNSLWFDMWIIYRTMIAIVAREGK